MVVWCTFFKFEVRQTAIIVSKGCHTQPRKFKLKKSLPNCHYYLQNAVTPDWMGSIAI
jgi:hypothetical protein